MLPLLSTGGLPQVHFQKHKTNIDLPTRHSTVSTDGGWTNGRVTSADALGTLPLCQGLRLNLCIPQQPL